MMRFDRFTERALDAATRSYEILQRYSHNQVDTEHMLLALLEQPEGVIPQILEKLGVDVERVKGRLDGVLKASPQGRHLRRRDRPGVYHPPPQAGDRLG